MGDFNLSSLNHKGSLDVKITMIMIGAIIFLLGLLWVVLVNVFNSSPLDVIESFRDSSTELKIEEVTIQNNGFSVVVTRESGRASLEKINFLISDGTNLQTIERESNLDRLESHTFQFNESELNGLLFLKEVSVSPVFRVEAEENGNSEITDTMEVSDEEILNGFGAISYWDFENNARDVIGLKNGIVHGGVSFEGMDFGNAAMFNGEDGYIDFGDFDQLRGSSSFSISFWIYLEEANFPHHRGIFSMGNEEKKTPWLFGYEGTKSIFAQFETSENAIDCSLGTKPIPLKKWTHISFTWDGENCMFYEDGLPTNSDPTRGDTLVDTNQNLLVGKNSDEDYFKGALDEIVIFDRKLTDQQFKAIYQLNSN